jgi:maleate isomerase
MHNHTRLGMLTPSSNTALEPICSAMLNEMPDVSAHFGRFRVTEIALEDTALAQFDEHSMLDAADLLADARVQAICWNGTSASWLGFDRDRALCATILERTGIPATSSVLALAEIFRRTGVERFGLVSPYLRPVQERIVEVFHREGFSCAAERHLGIRDNFAFSEVPQQTLETMIRAVAEARPDAITVLCTNLRAAPLAEELERELGIPIYDSVATALWGALRAAGQHGRRVEGWGRLLREID